MQIDFKLYTEITPTFSYNRLQCLGGGSFGKVYRGWSQEYKKQIAVKIVLNSILKRINGTEKHQIDIMQKLCHDNVLKLYGSSRSEEDGLFLFLQLCEQGCLSTLLQKKRLSEAEVLNMLKQLVSGMAYINSKGIFHRDLKPDNLLLTNDNQLKIADFGTARQFTGLGKNTFKRCTPIYSAPEVYLVSSYAKLEGKYDMKCDVFSTGYILFEMLTGQQLTKGIQTEDELRSFLSVNQKKGGFTFSHPAITQKWVTLLNRMLDFKVTSRATFDEINTLIKDFKVSEKALPQRPTDKKEQMHSSDILKLSIKYINSRINKNNYLVGLLRIFYQYQHEPSEFCPHVYKLLTLYLSLSRYCNLSQMDLTYLHSPQVIDNLVKQLGVAGQILPPDKKQLQYFIQEKAMTLNQAIEMIRTIMIRQVIPQLHDILRKSASPQKIIVEEYLSKADLDTFKQQEYFLNIDYINRFKNCVKNIYKTHAQTAALSNSDIRIYLTLLILSQERIVPQANIWPPLPDQIIQMQRPQLLKEISTFKNKLNL